MSEGSTPRRILLLTTAYGVEGRQAPLSNELVAELAAGGDIVTVVAIDWNAASDMPPRRFREGSGAEVLLFSPWRPARLGRMGRLIAKWLGSSLVVRRHVARALPDASFDLVFAFSPAVVMAAVIKWAVKRSRHSVLYITDFFPNHHVSLGLLPCIIAAPARWLENRLMRLFDVIACMSPRGIEYLRANYGMACSQSTMVLPLWGDVSPVGLQDRKAVRARYGFAPTDRIALFGGQITHGRGIENILQVAALAEDSDLVFLFLGNGPLVSLVETAQRQGRGNIRHIPALPRSDYLPFAAACDVGIVATVAGVDAPTFPSKTIDYLRVGLPVVAAVESATDYGQFVNAQGFGIAVQASDSAGMLTAIREILGDAGSRTTMREAARRVLTEVFDVAVAARRVRKLSSGSDG